MTATSAEELARIAGVKAETLRRTAKELFELLERDLEVEGRPVEPHDGRK
ncbi:MAG: hypothetical protein JRM99_03245 [Nitrososphaerota archaeon]|nr:hypothetical protein [Nitrososphaerota archaeon]